MNWFTSLATFMILWWLSLFIVLPIGVRGQAEADDVEPGTEPGAPLKSNMMRNALWATGLACMFYVMVYLTVTSGVITWEALGRWFRMT